MPQSTFGENVLRFLKASLSLDSKLRKITIQVVEGGEMGIDLLFDKESYLLRLHERWLDFSKIHMTSTCELAKLGWYNLPSAPFFCDHVVEDLLELVIQEVRPALDIEYQRSMDFRTKAREYIRQTPRGIQVSNKLARELEVRWTSDQNSLIIETYGGNIMYTVTLHSMSSCEAMLTDYLFDGKKACKCPPQDVSQEASMYVFKELNVEEKYFPMVARVGEQSFFGQPPEPISPLRKPVDIQQQSTSLPRREKPPMAPKSRSSVQKKSDNKKKDKPSATKENIPHPTKVRDEDKMVLDTDPNSESDSSEVDSVFGHIEDDIQSKTKKALEYDEKQWIQWYDDKLPILESRLFDLMSQPSGAICKPFTRNASNPYYEPLKYSFKINTYIRVYEKSKSTTDAQESSSSYIARIHQFHGRGSGCKINVAHLVVTKFSPIIFDPLFPDFSSFSKTREVLLHFNNTRNMGQLLDAEVIGLPNIQKVKPFPRRIRYGLPSDTSKINLHSISHS